MSTASTSTTGSAPTASATAPAGATFGPYRIDALIGRGGTGEVHQAYDTRRERAVALKRLPADVGTAGDATDGGRTDGADGVATRFRRAAELAGRLAEPHVIPIHDFGEIDGRLYLDMRLVEGADLATLLARHGPLPVEQVVSIGCQVATALDAAHHAGLVHRAVKPSNILVSGPDQDFVYLVDFGIADGVASPSVPAERPGGREDHRADIHALCRVLFEALAGAPPATDHDEPRRPGTPADAVAPRLGEVRDGVPPALDEVIARGLARDPDDRQQRAADLAAELQAASTARTGGSTVARKAPAAWLPAWLRMWLPAWWPILAVAASVVVAVVAVTVAIVATRGPGSPDPVAADAVGALAAKDRAGLDRVSCHRTDGRPTAQLPPDALALLQTARATGPTTPVLGSEARTAIELTLASGGRTQTLPAELVLTVDDGRWCVNSLVRAST